MPSSIDPTGATDVTSALNAWVASVPNGATISFPAGAVYRVDRMFDITGRSNLTFDGNGATIKSGGDATDKSSTFAIYHSTGIHVRDLVVAGNSPTPGVYIAGQEQAHGFRIVGGGNIEIGPNVTIRATYGDGISIDYWTDGLWVHDSKIESGRNAVAVLAGRNITIEHNAFDKNGGGVLDIEAYQSSGGADNVKFINNTSGTHGYGFFDANGAVGSVVTNITVSGNVLTGGTMGGTISSLPRRQNIVFTNNVSHSTAQTAGWGGTSVRYFEHIDGLVVTGNVQPLPSGAKQFAYISDCTNVTYTN